jgi:signal transduction histidine kinase/ligand-binding sensor domain-containing protein/DNA-binding response OmpR family regulator
MKSFKVFLLFMFFLTSGYGQEYKLYSNKDGLSKSVVSDIYKDSRGFMWFGTYVGLNRFDGFNFINYYYDVTDPGSISNNNIRRIIEDRNGDLWISTTYGLNKYIFDKDVFIRFYAGSNSISSNNINSIFFDNNHHLWIATSEGIDKYVEEIGTFTHYRFYAPGKEEKVAIYDITQDNRGIYWLCTDHYGLISFSQETEQYNFHLPEIPVTFSRFQKVSPGNLVVNSSKGNYSFDLKTRSFTFSGSAAYDIPAQISELQKMTITSGYIDDTGIHWYGIDNKGVVSFDYSRYKFTTFKKEGHGKGLPGEKISAIAQDQSGMIWLGTSNGLCSFNPVDHTFINENNSKLPIFHIKGHIVSLFFDRKGSLWIGSNTGLYKYHFNSNELKSFNYNPGDTTSLLGNRITSILEDSSGRIWVGANGLNLYQPLTNNFKQFKPSKNSDNSVNSEYVMNIYEDKSGKIWLSTWLGGINIFDPENQTFTFLMHNTDEPGPLKTNDVGSVKEDSKGFLWFTSFGVTRYNPLNKTFQWFSKIEGLPDNAISDILEDNNGMMWISTGNGLAFFDPENGSIRNFDRLDGLQENEFVYNTALKSSDGKLYFGGIDGFSIVDPDNLRINEHIPNVVITDFQIFNKSVKIGEEKNGHVTLSKNITNTREITLRHYESVFSFEFAALHYTIPEKNMYAYKLEGLEQDWNYTTSQRRYATYTTLKPGKYVFRVKASNSDGLWNEQGTYINITILPPWWQTGWFFAILLCTLCALILMFYYIQLRSIRKRNRRLDQLVQIKTKNLEEVNCELNAQKEHLLTLNQSLENYHAEIVAQKEAISQQNEILKAKNAEILDMSQRIHDQDQMKLRYFTNISHEFRTPLTLIISPLAKIIGSGKISKPLLEQLYLIESNARRLLNLVNQLLDLGKIDSGKMQVKKVQGNFIEFSKNIFKQFEAQAEKRKIHFSFKSEATDLEIFFDVDKMEKIMYNLLSNSFKFTPELGSISIEVGIENHNVICIVTDTGIGISQKEINRIFEPFYQVDGSSTRFHEGSGIGLYHTHELIDIINGSIQVSSELGKGTIIKVAFPYEAADQTDSVSQDRTPLFIPAEAKKDEIEIVDSQNKLKIDFKAKVLIVEDNSEMRNYLHNELSNKFKIIEATNGEEGLNMARNHYPDLIISDIMMPGMDGLEMCRILKTDPGISHIPIVLLTARAETSMMIEGIETGADEYIPKPFNIDLLLAKIEQLLQSRKALKEKFSKEVFSEPSNIAYTSADRVFLQKLISLVENNLTNEEFLVHDIAQEIGMGKTNLYKKVLALTNQPVAEFVRNIRLKKAAHLLLTQEYSVSEVAFMVGFKDTSHFIKSFSRQYNLTPKKFIEQQKANLEQLED